MSCNNRRQDWQTIYIVQFLTMNDNDWLHQKRVKSADSSVTFPIVCFPSMMWYLGNRLPDNVDHADTVQYTTSTRPTGETSYWEGDVRKPHPWWMLLTYRFEFIYKSHPNWESHTYKPQVNKTAMWVEVSFHSADHNNLMLLLMFRYWRWLKLAILQTNKQKKKNTVRSNSWSINLHHSKTNQEGDWVIEDVEGPIFHLEFILHCNKTDQLGKPATGTYSCQGTINLSILES